MTDVNTLLKALFQAVEIPPQRILFLHARLRRLSQISTCNYAALTDALLEHLWALQPRAILVPAYTIYGFMHSRIFHPSFSHSEVGRFAEEIRLRADSYRSPDPMYSLSDVGGQYLPQLQHIDYSKTFGPGSLLQHLLEQDQIVFNIDLDGLWCTHMHQAEIAAGVDYRQFNEYPGMCWPQSDAHAPQPCRYQAYLRRIKPNGQVYPSYQRYANQQRLLAEGVLHSSESQHLQISWFSSQAFVTHVTQWLQTDPRALIEN